MDVRGRFPRAIFREKTMEKLRAPPFVDQDGQVLRDEQLVRHRAVTQGRDKGKKNTKLSLELSVTNVFRSRT